MIGAKHKPTAGWNPFKRSYRKQKLPEERAVLSPYEDSLYNKANNDSGNMDTFSVTSLPQDEQTSFNHSNEENSPKATYLQDEPLFTTPFDKKEIGDPTDTSSFDSFFESAVELDMDDSSFLNDTFMSESAPRQRSIDPKKIKLEDRIEFPSDLEDFDSVIFDPVALSKTPRSVTTTPRSQSTTQKETTIEVSTSGQENENGISLLEFKSPLNQDVPNSFFQDESDENDPSNAKNPVQAEQKTDNPRIFEHVDALANSSPSCEVLDEMAGQNTPRRGYTNFIQKRKSKPFRSRLMKTVLAPKGASSTPPQPMSPLGCSTNSTSIQSQSPRKHLPMTPRTPRTPQTQLSPPQRSLPKTSTTPRSKLLWSKSKSSTPRNAMRHENERKILNLSPSTPESGVVAQLTPEAKTELKGIELVTSADEDNATEQSPGFMAEYGIDEEGDRPSNGKESPANEEGDDHSLGKESPAEGSSAKEADVIPDPPLPLTRAHTFTHREAPGRNEGLVKSKSETEGIIGLETVEDFKQEWNTTAAPSFEAETLQLSVSHGFCCSSGPEGQICRVDVIENGAESDVANATLSPPQPQLIPPLTPAPRLPENPAPDTAEQVIRTSSTLSLSESLSLPPPPPPPLPKKRRPGTPRRKVRSRKASENEMKSIDKHEDNKKQSRDDSVQLKVLKAAEQEQFFPAVDSSESNNAKDESEQLSPEPTDSSVSSDSESAKIIEPPLSEGLGNEGILESKETISFESALDFLSGPQKVDSNDKSGSSTSLGSLDWSQSDGSSDIPNNDDEKENAGKKSRLRKSVGKMLMIRGRKKKKGFPLPRRPSHSMETVEEEREETSLVEWFDSQSFQSTMPFSQDSSQSDTPSKPPDPPKDEEIVTEKIEEDKRPLDSSGLVKVSATGKTKSNLIYWSGTTDDFEIIAMNSSNNLSTGSGSWMERASLDAKDAKPANEKLSKITRTNSNDRDSLRRSMSVLSNQTGSTSSKVGVETNRTKDAGKASQRTDKAMPRAGKKKSGSKSPKIGDTIAADLFVSACSSLSDSSSDGSSSSCSDSSSSDSESCASDSAILTPSEIALQNSAAYSNPSHLLSSGSESDDDVFNDIEDDYQDQKPKSTNSNRLCNPCQVQPSKSESTKKRSHTTSGYTIKNSDSFASLSSDDSTLYSSSQDSRLYGESDIDVHVRKAQEWLNRMTTTFLGDNDDESTVLTSTIANTLQCEYTGVLGRLKINVNQNK